MAQKILDVFLFYNELDLLKARLEYLGEIVDQFIISEADIDFSGKQKEFLLSEKLIATLPYSEKIIYHREHIDLNSIPWLYRKIKYRNKNNSFLWKIQDCQRNSTLRPLSTFDDREMIIFSDLDEFPSEQSLVQGMSLIKNKSVDSIGINAYSCEQTFFYYNLNNAAPKGEFYGSVITDLSTFKKYSPHKLRSDKNNLSHIPDGGWHFSYFMDKHQILKKIFAISDVENLSQFKKISATEVQKKIDEGSDLYNRGTKLSNQERLIIPEKIVEAIKKYLPDCA